MIADITTRVDIRWHDPHRNYEAFHAIPILVSEWAELLNERAELLAEIALHRETS